MIFSGQEMGWKDQPISILQQESLDQFYTPESGEVIDAFVADAFKGVGSLNADNLRNQVIEFEKNGTPLTEEAYKNSDYYRSTIPYYKDITAESAKLLSEYEDEQAARAFTISKSTTGQFAVGFATAFAAGTVEPKNLIFGAATAGLGAGVLSLRRLVKMRQALGKYGSMAAIGTAEGFVSALAAEPSNRYSAKILHQDYTMADSAWNVATSAVLGAGLATAPTFIKDKFKRRKFNRAFEDYIDEVETSVAQLAQGQKIDIAAVEKINDGVIAKKPVAEKAAMVEAFVRYTETPEFKARFEGSKIVDAEGAPLRVYHGTTADFKNFSKDSIGKNFSDYSIGQYFTTSPEEAAIYTQNSETGSSEGANLRPVYIDAKNPLEVKAPEGMNASQYIDTDKGVLAEQVIKGGHDSLIVTDSSGNKNIVTFSPDQIISAFGADDMDAIAKRMDNQNLEVAKQAAVAGNDPANSTAIDFEAARAVEEYDTTIDQMIEYEEEIAALREQGLLSEADEMALASIEDFNLDDAASAYEAAYFCLTRG